MTNNPLSPHKQGLDPEVRVLLGRQLREYYERMRQTTASESLKQLLRHFEIGTLPAGGSASGAMAEEALQRSGSGSVKLD